MSLRDRLPSQYLDNMRKVPDLEFDAFLGIYDEAPVKALRFNPCKARRETIDKLVEAWHLEPVPWCRDAYYYEESENLRPGLSPYHDAGVYYIQEPSAMITAERAEISPNDIVLDLCAAPGGKSTQAAAKARYLVSNEPIPGRARILSSNIERMGFSNCIVSSAYPDELAAVFTGYFDKIIVDAPCSGEGMMRKDETAIAEWSPANVALCIKRQAEILDAAASMLKTGGRLIYSTCTFEYGENDGQIADFLAQHDDFVLISSETLYPHRIRGEGHFCAVLKRRGTDEADDGTESLDYRREDRGTANSDKAQDNRPLRANDTNPKKTSPKKRSKDATDTLSDIADYMRRRKIHVLRSGVERGETFTDRKGNKRYEPSHAEALSDSFGTLTADSINLFSESDALDYLRGSVIELDKLSPDKYELNSDGGWLTVMYDGYPLGLGKLTRRMIKNHYPKGLRRY